MPSTGARRRAGLSGAKGVGRSEPAVLVVAADASGPVEDGVRAVRVDMDLDPRAHEMGPHRAFGDLQFQRAVGDAIVLADLPLLLDAQDLVEIDAGNGREGRALAGGLNREAGVVFRQIAVADEGVGRLHIGYAGEPQFLRQPILQRRERPLGSPSGLRRIGPDMLDAQLLERPSDLGRMAAAISPPAFGV